MVINNYTVCHLSLFIQNGEAKIIFYFLIKLIKNYIMILKKKQYELLFIFCVIVIFLFLEIFAMAVFLEYTQINCCGLNKNIKENIMKREVEDIALITNEIDTSFSKENKENDDNLEEVNNKEI